MEPGDTLKALGKQAQEAVAANQEKLHGAVQSAARIANERTGGKYAETVTRLGDQAKLIVTAIAASAPGGFPGSHGDIASDPVAHESGSFAIGGDTNVYRLGYGAMQLTGQGVWGDPKEPDEAVRVLQRAVALGVNFIDTADSYGPFVSEMLIKQALHPYPEDLVIATKAGLARCGPGDWRPLARPEYLRQQCLLSLRHLGLEQIPLYQLHRIDSKVPLAEQLGELVALQQEGLIRHIGLSEVTVEQLIEAQRYAKIVTVQNLYNLSNRQAEPLLEHCAGSGIGFIPWFPLATGKLSKPGGPLDTLAKEIGATPSQLALAWLLRRSPVMLPIPGTGSVSHLEENVAAAQINLTDAQFAALTAAAG
jgi:aryl-alcohol dehydrogenase-like predicted oxidoreductase